MRSDDKTVNMKPFLLLIALLGLTLVAACGDDDNSASETPASNESATESAEPTTPAPATGECAPNTGSPFVPGDLTWDAVLPATVPAPDGWSLSADGDNPQLLAVTDDTDAAVGTVSLSQSNIIKFVPSDGYEGLVAWANHEVQALEIGRTGDNLTTTVDELQEVSFGDFCGIAYGYTVTDGDGAVVARYAGRATYDASMVYKIVALYEASGDDDRSFASAEALATYEPFLTPLVESLNVPAP